MLPVEKRINSKKELTDTLKLETNVNRGGVSSYLRYILQYGERAILDKHQILLRKSEYYVNTHKRVRAAIYKFRLTKFQNKYSIHIPINCCQKGLRLMHVGPVLMNSRVCVGENCVIHINTALVAGGTSDDAPILCDGVIVGVGAAVVGGVKVASNVAIGANAVVNRDVAEENIAVAGVPAKKISNNGRLTWNNGNN